MIPHKRGAYVGRSLRGPVISLRVACTLELLRVLFCKEYKIVSLNKIANLNRDIEFVNYMGLMKLLDILLGFIEYMMHMRVI